MKNLATLAVIAMTAISASAASINWGFGGNTWVSEDGSASKLASEFTGNASSSYIALVYVGQNVTTLTDSILNNIAAGDVVAQASYAMGTTSKSANSWVVPSTATPATISSSKYSIGASFAVLFNNGSAWDYFYGVNTSSGAVGDAMKSNVLTLNDVSDNAQAVSIFGTRLGTTSSAVAGAVTVPEPTTAALALAGLALLLKRRKA